MTKHSHNLPKQVRDSLLRWSAHTWTLESAKTTSIFSDRPIKLAWTLVSVLTQVNLSANVTLALIFVWDLLGMYYALIANHLCASCSPRLCNSAAISDSPEACFCLSSSWTDEPWMTGQPGCMYVCSPAQRCISKGAFDTFSRVQALWLQSPCFSPAFTGLFCLHFWLPSPERLALS